MYEGLKHFHMLTIAISAFLLSVRCVLVMMNSPYVQYKLLKIVSHSVDTFLILSGLGLIHLTGFIPFTMAAPWMTEKLTCVLAYFALGFFALKLARNNLLRAFAFFGALGWLGMAGKVAVTKMPVFFG